MLPAAPALSRWAPTASCPTSPPSRSPPTCAPRGRRPPAGHPEADRRPDGLKLDDLVQRETQRRIAQMATVATGAMLGMVVDRRPGLLRQRRCGSRPTSSARSPSTRPPPRGPPPTTWSAPSSCRTRRPRTRARSPPSPSWPQRRPRPDASSRTSPAIQARLLATLGRAYNNLGLLSEARPRWNRDAGHRASRPGRRRGHAGAGDDLPKRGRAGQGAAATVRRAEALLGPDPTAHRWPARAAAALTEGRILISATKVKEGVAAFDRALAYYRMANDTPPAPSRPCLTTAASCSPTTASSPPPTPR